jgi:hypothetical protein
MILLNFSHPLTESQQVQIEALTGNTISRVIMAMPQFDEQQPFSPQINHLLATLPLASAQWQEEPILVLLPSLNCIAAVLLAKLHGRMGYFPPVVRTRPVAGAVPRRFEVAEVLDLQGIREHARHKRM